MSQQNKETLRRAFRDGEANQQDFVDLIDSTVNKLDDGIDIDRENGLKLTLKGGSKKLLSFYENMSEDSLWSMSMQAGQNNEGLNFTEGRESRLFIQKGGQIGMGTTQPNYKLDVKGLVGMKGRVGTYADGYIAATGEWKAIIGPLEGCHAFEVIAHINDDHDTRYALTYATVLLSSGASGSKRRVIATDAASSWLWGQFWNKIQFRWKLNEKKSQERNKALYELQIRSRSHYGLKNGRTKTIFFRVAKLWDRSYEKQDYNPMDLSVQPTPPPPPQRNIPAPPPPPRQQQRTPPPPSNTGGRPKLRIKKK